MKKLQLTALLLAVGISAAPAQTIQPSAVEKREDLGDYQKISYVSQSSAYNGIEYREAYLVNGFQLFFSPQATIIVSPDKKEIFFGHNNSDGWSAYPTFYFPRNKNRPFVISVEKGMEQYRGSDIYVIDKDYSCTFAGCLDIAPATGNYKAEEYLPIETVLRLNDQGKKGIRFTFACDSLVSMPGNDSRFSDIFPSQDIYFTFTNNTLAPCHKWEKLPGVQRAKLYTHINKPVSSIHFLDANSDGQEDMVYVVRHREYVAFDEKTQKNVQQKDGTAIVVCLCKNGTIKEELIFDFDEPIDIEYEYRDNGIITVRKYTSDFRDKTKTTVFYRLDGKELVEVIS